jgi:nucleotide-binding universal stress UspA family protein
MAGRVCEHAGDLTGTVVVGADGSECGRHALRFAAAEARMRGCPLVALRAWSLTTAPRPPDVPDGIVPPMTSFESAVADEVRTEVREELGESPGIDVVILPVHDAADSALVEASRTATLVVVGHRGHGGVAGLLLGSVSDHLVHHGQGPVAVVR